MSDRWNGLTAEKKMVAASFLFVFLTFATAGVFFEQSTTVSSYGLIAPYDSQLPTQYTSLGEDSSSKTLKAIVKGSIYKTGENMTVYGACFSGDGYLLPEAVATFTAWYPNGSIVTGPNASMDAITVDQDGFFVNGTGRHKIHVTMSSTQGTYLTEMRCSLDGEWAVAFGEWQNPEWVQDIANTYSNVTNIYQLLQDVAGNLSIFQNDTAYNFSQVLTAIENGNGDTANLAIQLREFESQVRALDVNRWLIHEPNPFYLLGSGNHNWRGIDMLNDKTVAAVSSDGYFGIWDGEVWSEVLVPSTEFRDVSILPANVVYAWGVGASGGSPAISVNGANSTTINYTGGSPTAMNAIKMFHAPNNPSADFYVYMIGNDGSAYMSSDSGVSYSLIGSLDAGNVGRVSDVVENYDSFAQPNGFMTILGQGGTVAVHDGTTWTDYVVSGIVRGVDLLYYDLGYVIVEDASDTKIYKYNGTDFTLEYTIDDPSIIPSGIEVHSQDDIWVTTRDPSVFYHFDGRNWEYSTLAYSDFASVIISFSGNASNVTNTGLHDLTMSDSRHGFAAGDDGLIMIYQSQSTSELADLLANLTAQLDAMEVNLTPILDALFAMNLTLEDVDNKTLIIIQNLQEVNLTTNEILSVVNQLNLTVNQGFDNVTALINAVNVTLNDRFDVVDQNNSAIYDFLVLMNFSMEANFDDIYGNLTFISNQISLLNTTVTNELQDIDDFLFNMNVSFDYKLNNILSNVTYTNQYLTTTLFPLINDTNQYVQNIWIALGFMNETINNINETTTQTLDIVNESATDIDYLVNQSNRIRAWITQ